MQWKKTISLIEAHAEGEVGRVVTGGVTDLPGNSMLKKMTYINEVDDSLRRFLVFEPRGYAQMSTNLLLPPCDPQADAGFIILQGDKAHAMSGSNCICVVTVLLETGMLEMHEPTTTVKLDTPAGLISAKANCHQGKCVSVELNMPASFVLHSNAELEMPEFGKIKLDIAYGGVFYALVDPKQFSRQLKLSIAQDKARELVRIGTAIHRQINATMAIEHPQLTQIKGLAYVMFIDNKENGDLLGATILPPGRIDRSPCGTGNSARLALDALNGKISQGETVKAYSIIDSHFNITHLGTAQVGDYTAVLPKISGRGWIHGIHQLGLDPTDPYPLGYKLTDCWGDAFDLLS